MSKRILVVEDREDLRAILRDFLSTSGYTVIEAVDGAECVAKAASEHPILPVQRTGRKSSFAHWSMAVLHYRQAPAGGLGEVVAGNAF